MHMAVGREGGMQDVAKKPYLTCLLKRDAIGNSGLLRDSVAL